MCKFTVSIFWVALLSVSFITLAGFAESEGYKKSVEPYLEIEESRAGKEAIETLTGRNSNSDAKEYIKKSIGDKSQDGEDLLEYDATKTDSLFEEYVASDLSLKLFRHHINHAFERINNLTAPQQRLVTLVQLAFTRYKKDNSLFSLAKIDGYTVNLLHNLIDHVDVTNKQQVNDIFLTAVQSLAALITSYGLDLDYAFDLNKNILVYTRLLPKNNFVVFLEKLSANTTLACEDKVLLLFQYVLSVITLNAIYNEQMGKVHSPGQSPVLVNLKAYYSSPKGSANTVSGIGKFIDRNIGRENFFMGFGLVSTFVVGFGSNKLISKISGKEFDATSVAIQTSVPLLISAAIYAINKCIFQKKQ